MKRKICVVITARASYSRVKTALTAITQHPALELQLVVSSSALLSKYGAAVDYIERDGFEIIAKVQNVIEGENLNSSAKTVGLGILELSTIFENIKPDAVVTIADRFETIATATTASIMNIPLVHIQGGEISGNIDDRIRHAITKLADIHFVTTEDARNRVLKLGEDPNKVFHTGCPSIDLASQILKSPALDFNPYERYGGVGGVSEIDGKYLVVMLHPVTTQHELAREQVNITLNAIREIDIPTFWFWPNADAGSGETSKGIRTFREENEQHNIHFFKNMESLDFLKLLKNSACLVGNSSVGIRECSFLGIPVVNIGIRQQDRQRGSNVIDVEFNLEQIVAAINNHLKNGRVKGESIYGTGNSGNEIAQILATTDLTNIKRLAY